MALENQNLGLLQRGKSSISSSATATSALRTITPQSTTLAAWTLGALSLTAPYPQGSPGNISTISAPISDKNPALGFSETQGQEIAHRPLRALVDGKTVEFASVQQKFEALSQIWRRFNWGKSVINYGHPAYFQIVAMGEPVIPYLLREIENGGGTWYPALQYITGETAESPEMRGNPEAVRNAWLEWGRINGKWSPVETS